MFLAIDDDGDGTLDREEITIGLTKLYGEQKALIEVENIFKGIDQDGDEKIDFTEFK